MQKSNHCLFAPCCHLRSGKDLIWMWRNKGPLVLISVWTILEFLSLSCISEVLCNLPLTFLRAGAAEPWWSGLLACLLQSHLLTVRIGLRIWWVLRVWLGNCSLAALTPMNDNQSYPRERGYSPNHLEADLWYNAHHLQNGRDGWWRACWSE